MKPLKIPLRRGTGTERVRIRKKQNSGMPVRAINVTLTHKEYAAFRALGTPEDSNSELFANIMREGIESRNHRDDNL
jgi:hypothetical protein